MNAATAADMELVVAVSEDDVIGRDNALPWRLPADLRRFKAITLGRGVLMGRKTFESIGRALPGRRNFVLTRGAQIAAPGCTVVSSLEAALEAARGGDSPLMVIGGAEIYRQCLPFARRIHLTLVHTRVADGDTRFSDWRGREWRETAREFHEADEKNTPAYSFVTLERAAVDM
jgi:dihydrofolate reductase